MAARVQDGAKFLTSWSQEEETVRKGPDQESAPTQDTPLATYFHILQFSEPPKIVPLTGDQDLSTGA
jgi:hypothetical protein